MSQTKKRVLVSDSLTDEGVRILSSDGEFDVDYKPDISAKDLEKEIAAYSALVIRSRTTVTKEILAAASKLEVVGRAGVGVDNVDVEEATSRGVIVMNTPDGNTFSTAEHSVSMLLALARRIPYADATMKKGKWEKKSIVGMELFGKTLGICGLGRIGREVASRAQAFGMRVVGHDPYMSREAAEKLRIELKSDVNAVVQAADIVTVHCPLNSETRGLIGKDRIALAKDGVLIVNCARGGIVDEAALLEGLKSGKVGGAALDVFEKEPLPADHPFRTMDNVVMTPHLGAATVEAQENVARDIAGQIVDALKGTVVRNAVNAPSIDAESLRRVRPYLTLGERMGRFVGQVFDARMNRLEVEYSGAVCDYTLEPITTAIVKGLLEPRSSEAVNYVNAMHRAKSRGIKVVESRLSEAGDYSSLITIRAHAEGNGACEVVGTLFGHRQPRLVRVNGIETEICPEGSIIVIENEDRPGIIGGVAAQLGKRNINIAEMALGRVKAGDKALTCIKVDGVVSDEVLAELRALPSILEAKLVVC